MQLLRARLRNFKLSGIYHNLEERVSYAKEKSLSYPEFLGLLLEDEENNRRTNSYKRLTATKKDILEPNFRLIKTLRTLIFLFSLLSINATSMIVLLVTLLPRREILSLSVTPVPGSLTFPSLLVLRL